MDPIEIKVVGTNDSGPAIQAAEKDVKALGQTVEKTGKDLKSSGKAAGDYGSDVKDMGSSAEAAEADVKSLGDAAASAGKRVKGAGDGLGNFGDSVRKSGKDADDAATRLDRLGESADVGESRFIGLASGIDGATSLMSDPSPQEMAQGIADLSDGIAKTAVPWMIKARDAVGGLIDRMGGMKLAAGAAATIGVAALTAELVALDQQMEQETSKNLDDLSLKLQGVNYASTPATEGLIQVMASIGKLDELWERAKAAGDEQALQFLELAADAGISGEQIAKYREELEIKNAAEEAGVTATQRMTEAMKAEGDAIRGVNDARRAAVDPLFAMLDAMNQQRDSQRSVNEAFVAYGDAVKEHGEGSAEAADALRALNDAQDDAVMSAADLESATSDLEAQIKEHPATLGNAINSLERWKAQGSITADQAARMETRFRNAAREANRIDGTSTRNLNARDNASGKIISVGNRLRDLDGTSATVTLNAEAIIRKVTSGFGFAGGGRVPEYHASGGLGGGMHPGGPRGTDIVPAWLTPGEVVFNKPQQRELLNMLGGAAMGGGGGGTVTLTWAGGPSDDLGMAIWNWMQRRVQVSFGGDVNRALGG